MYKRTYQGSILLISLILITGILAMIFLAKEDLIRYERVSNNSYQSYLNEKIKLITENKKDKNQYCIENKKEEVRIILGNLDYVLNCKKLSLFKVSPNSKKYISLSNLSDELDIEHYSHMIHKIYSLNELPNSSISDPKVVIAENDIDETLTKDFYGIILTEHLFDISGSAKIYGKLYSTFNNEREERNLTYKKEVLENLDNATTTWEYLPNSTRMAAHEKTP